ncbi:hypothetical protein VMF7928_00576 [Vibrio marisflavi CECT 7928]|uniref:Integrase n=1 Tax=Vibrio marisflavi CECT 7928 TaxID=634439 RepID=A0ABN8DYY5_9VIBR|nr:hypothetical protein VMF7928_00576 [Vibrio marisflavi CECT 7928]
MMNMRKISCGEDCGIKRPFKLAELWRIGTSLEIENGHRCNVLSRKAQCW